MCRCEEAGLLNVQHPLYESRQPSDSTALLKSAAQTVLFIPSTYTLDGIVLRKGRSFDSILFSLEIITSGSEYTQELRESSLFRLEERRLARPIYAEDAFLSCQSSLVHILPLWSLLQRWRATSTRYC